MYVKPEKHVLKPFQTEFTMRDVCEYGLRREYFGYKKRDGIFCGGKVEKMDRRVGY